MKQIVQFLTKNPVMFRTSQIIFVWFGMIVGVITFLAVLTVLIFANIESLPYFSTFFIFWPLAAVAGAIVFFHGFWFQLFYFRKAAAYGGNLNWKRPSAVFYGGFLGSIILAVILAYRFPVSLLSAADFIFPFVAIFHGLSRLACLNFGCCYGRRTSLKLPWMVYYSNPLSEPLRFGSNAGECRHPTQLYEMVSCLLLGIFLLSLFNHVHQGTIVASYLIGYGSIRFLLEFLRDNSFEKKYGNASIWQLLSVAFVIIGCSLYLTLPPNEGLQFQMRIKPVSFNSLAIALWDGAFIGTTLGLHFRKMDESL